MVPAADYRALTAGAGVVQPYPRTLLRMTGKDRGTFLHAMCTNDIRRLAPGESCEAFLTTVQGKTADYVYVHCRDADLLVETVPGRGADLVASLDRYLIREDVQLHDDSDQIASLLLAGKESPHVLARLQWEPSPPPIGNVLVRCGEAEVTLRRVPLLGPDSFLLSCAIEQMPKLAAALEQHGAAHCAEEAAEVVRIEYGSPVYGREVTLENLPQEVDRNSQAISFTKGCYLGQETVARLDALGHVNRLLVGLHLSGSEVPSPGTLLTSQGKPLARITSACHSPRLGGPLAMAYVRRGNHVAGTELQTDQGPATVVALPLA